MTTYEIIKDLCEKANTNPANVERAVGIANGSIGSWRRSRPSTNSIQKVADYFNVPIEYLLTGIMPEQSSEVLIAAVIKQAFKDDSSARLDLVKKIYSLTPEECQKVLDIIPVLFNK